MSTDRMFEKAVRTKLRFSSPKGDLSVEQLWEVPLRSKDTFNLDTIAKQANARVKDLGEESFVETHYNPAKTQANLAFEIVKYIITVKKSEEEAAKQRAANRDEKDKLLRILAEKKDAALSVDELTKRINELDSNI